MPLRAELSGILKMSQRAVALLECAVRLHRIDCPENILRPDGKYHPFCVLLAGADYADHFAIRYSGPACRYFRDWRQWSAGRPWYLPEIRCRTHITLVVNNLGAGITEGEKLFAQFAASLADAIGQAIEGMIRSVFDLQQGEVGLAVQLDDPGADIPLSVFCTSTTVAFFTTWAFVIR